MSLYVVSLDINNPNTCFSLRDMTARPFGLISAVFSFDILKTVAVGIRSWKTWTTIKQLLLMLMHKKTIITSG